MGLFRRLVGTAVDIVTLPLAVVEDVSDTLQGYKPKNTKERIVSIAEDGVEIVEDTLNLDL